MIDTIIIAIPRNKVIVLDEAGHGVPDWDLQSRTGNYRKYVKNPSAKDKASGLYFPCLTGYHRKSGEREWTAMLKIEFSAPKLLFNNNLDELADNQFSAVVDALLDRLERLGVRVQRPDIESAEIRAIHYSKNIELIGGYTSQYVISELSKINLNKRFDLTKTRFMNDGQSLYGYTKAHSFVIYDKVADLKKNPKRAIDKAQSSYQMGLFASLNDTREFLRLEVRLSEKRKLNKVFKTLGFSENPTFKEAFATKISQTVVQHYWDTMIEKNSLLLFSHSITAKDLLKQILLVSHQIKGKTAIYLIGLLLLAREGSGLRELRTTLAKRSNDRLWYRLYSDLTETTAKLNELRPREWYDQVKRALVGYKPIHIGKVAL